MKGTKITMNTRTMENIRETTKGMIMKIIKSMISMKVLPKDYLVD